MNTHTFFASICIPLFPVLIYLPFQIQNPWTKYILLFDNALIFYLLAALSLAFTAEEKWKNTEVTNPTSKNKNETASQEEQQPKENPSVPNNTSLQQKWTLTTILLGLISGTYILTLPIIHPISNPLLDCLLRVTTFFYSCKLLDLNLTRASDPPLFTLPTPPHPPQNWPDRIAYISLLLTQTRYASFSIAVKTPTRLEKRSKLWDHVPWIAIPLTILFPYVAEFKVLSGLIVIQNGLELLHTLIHGRICSDSLFNRPFSSGSLGEFWGVRWHQGAQPFLYNLGYKPVARLMGKYFGKNVGRAAGVLATFSLSGIWHGWCAMSLVRQEYAWTVAGGLWLVFVLQGVGCLAERMIWGKEGGGWIQSVVVWAFAIEVGAIWFRLAEAGRVRIDWLEDMIASR